MIGFSAFAQEAGDWYIERAEWTQQDEINYSLFVQALGRTKCNTVDACIRSTANPYRDTDPADYKFFSDCADFPYFLRAYFAWKNRLPFGYVSQVKMFDITEEDIQQVTQSKGGDKFNFKDPRSAVRGNYPVDRRSLVSRNNKPLNFFKEMVTLQNRVQSGMLRIPMDLDTQIANDFYSPKIQPGSVRPGTVIYDPSGHVVVIYDVLPDGRIQFFDAHPDNSVTYDSYSARIQQSRPAHGAGFKNFRPVKLVGARTPYVYASDLIGGKLVYAKNEEIPDYSMEQYYGTEAGVGADNWRKASYSVKGFAVRKFTEFVRRSMATEKINPVNEFTAQLSGLCENFQERMLSVDLATQKKIHLMDHPDTLPQNLFMTSGIWEDYATSGRDARLRKRFVDIKETIQDRFDEWKSNIPESEKSITYSGTDLRKDLLRAFNKVIVECSMYYRNSAGQNIPLPIEVAIRRLYKMSFDPYHCPELRWGATSPEELKTCSTSAVKQRWYRAEQGLRNRTDRDWQAPSPITIEMLESGEFSVGKPPEVDFRSFLENLTTSKGGQ